MNIGLAERWAALNALRANPDVLTGRQCLAAVPGVGHGDSREYGYEFRLGDGRLPRPVQVDTATYRAWIAANASAVRAFAASELERIGDSSTGWASYYTAWSEFDGNLPSVPDVRG